MIPCPACGCAASDGTHVHALVAALCEDDADRALELGLLDPSLACAACGDACRALRETARAQRASALAARERFRARNARLQHRQQERDVRRKPVAVATTAPALPPAAAAALARAKAKAAERGPR